LVRGAAPSSLVPLGYATGLLAFLSLLVGCAHTPPAPAQAPVIHATPTVVTPHEDETPEEAFQRAKMLLVEVKGAEAGPIFDRLSMLDPNGEVAPPAHFNAGISWEVAGNRELALTRFREVMQKYADRELGKWGALRASRLEAYLEQWSQLSATADLLLARPDLLDVERLEAYGAKALSIVESGDPDGAERFIARGRDIMEKLHLGEGGKVPIEVAQIFFALGEVRKQRSEAIVFVPLPANFAEALEQRCQGLLDAQSAYSDAMRSFDAHWAAMSGFRVGELYQNLHKDVLAISPPKAASTAEKKRLFEGAMALRYRILLEKGLKMMEHTVTLGDRTGEASSWVERARAAKKQIESALDEQKAKLEKLPYTEKDLQKALDDLAAKSKP
jgi:hypothetical protein